MRQVTLAMNEAGYVKRNGSVGGVFLHGGTVSLFINVSASYYTS